MVLKVVSLTKRNGSNNWWYRLTIPADVQRMLAKLPNHPRPKGWFATHIMITTGTPDRTLAKAKAVDIAADVERQFKALREGPRPLTAKQISALSGVVYRAFAEGLENNPGLTSQQWLRVAEENKAAQRGEYSVGARLGIFKDDGERRDADVENRFGGIVDATLRREAVLTTEDSRWQVIEAVARDLTEGVKKLARNADGDFTADTYGNRFPPPTDLLQGISQTGKSLTALADAWHTAAVARGVRQRDARRWRAVVLRFKEWLTYDDLSRITPQKVQAWGDERSAAGVAPKTINDTDFAALRAVFGWGRQRDWLATNPAKEARIAGRGKKRTREKWFLEDEIAAILNAALAVQGTKRENPKTTAAKRWVPWLCAYSGARVVEMIQLRKEDIRREGIAWVIRVNPEAGHVKTDDYRDVPVHEHLIATGFIEFVQQSRPGHLFCDVGKDGNTAGTADGVYKRVYTMVRSVLTDDRVQPNHAWRYTFKTYGHDAGLNDLTIDAICGHAARTQGEKYRGITVKKRVEVMAAFPRYKLTGVERAEAA
ncbi:site-specific integrase [Bradyrhizobium cosmicum]|uniref:site-specific integrase n=1 Tax=Bradyrhizobium cosmicum TaxID=1404864 RepID=UPI0028E2FBE4|nr:site-specific integrase [Bradyrhizobium cosmicum]